MFRGHYGSAGIFAFWIHSRNQAGKVSILATMHWEKSIAASPTLNNVLYTEVTQRIFTHISLPVPIISLTAFIII